MKDHVHKNAVIDLKTQYIDKRAEVEVQLVESSEQVRQLRQNINAFDGAIAACDVILSGITEQPDDAEESTEKVEEKQEQPKKVRR